MSKEPTLMALILILLVAATACVAPTAQPVTSAAIETSVNEEPAISRAVAPTTGSQDSPIPGPPTPQQRSVANADVEFVRAIRGVDRTWTFHVTVSHPDTGWEDYADGWDVVLPGGMVIKPDPGSPFTRLLTHPHETEQPFTRSQGNIVIPENVSQVRVRAHDLIDGWGGKEIIVDLTAASGSGFEVESTD